MLLWKVIEHVVLGHICIQLDSMISGTFRDWQFHASHGHSPKGNRNQLLGSSKHKWVSSAYRWYCTPCCLTTYPNGELYKVRSTVHKTDPWVTPHVKENGSDDSPFIITRWSWPVSQASNQCRAWSFIPRVCSSRWSSVLWITVSNATLESSRIRHTTCFLVEAHENFLFGLVHLH